MIAKRQFLERLLNTQRSGAKELAEWLCNETDFFDAPASTRYHGNLTGGLCAHSIKVANRLLDKASFDEFWCSKLSGTPKASMEICGLLHDVCKINTYEKYYRNVKVYLEHETPFSKQDTHGWYEWAEEEAYRGNYNQILPHAEQSISLITKFIRLTNEEEMAIRYHMGFTEPKEHWQNMNVAIEKYPLVLALQQADMESSHFLEITIERK